MSERVARFSSSFGIELQRILSARGMSPTELHWAARRKSLEIPVLHIQDYLTHRKIPDAATVRGLAIALSLPPERAVVLHRAAALDLGYLIEVKLDDRSSL